MINSLDDHRRTVDAPFLAPTTTQKNRGDGEEDAKTKKSSQAVPLWGAVLQFTNRHAGRTNNSIHRFVLKNVNTKQRRAVQIDGDGKKLNVFLFFL